MWSILYNLFITPIEMVIEYVLYFAQRVVNNYGLSIVAVSLVVQTLVLPLYVRSDAIQEEERKRQKDMSSWVSHIKKNFKGEERFMILSAYYRQQGYKPWFAIKSSISLLLQIPFFIAAYNYLSEFPLFKGEGFLFIRDLGQPDAAFSMMGFSINIMPILMTVINICSGLVWSKGMPQKEKIQMYGLAAAFLVLLYNSPSGLVLYWTMNNVYSLCKNIVMKLRQSSTNRMKKHELPWCKCRLKSIPNVNKLFLIETIFLPLFMGGIISINIIRSSPTEFMGENVSPVSIIVTNLSVFIGVFCIWFRVFFEIMRPKARYIFTMILAIISLVGFADYMFWGNDYGKMSTILVYDNFQKYGLTENIKNFVIVCVIAIVVIWLTKKYIKQLTLALGIITVTAFCYLTINVVTSQIQVTKTLQAREESGTQENVFKLSKNGKNVIVIMLDRAIGSYVPFIMEELPELRKAFDGFTYYSNSLSYAKITYMAAPTIYGGYEYVPDEINKRSDEALVDKHNEALLVLPRLFSENGYDVTVTDPPYAGYEWVPDLSIYDGYDGIEAYNLEGVYTSELNISDSDLCQKKMFLYHSIMRVCPTVMQANIYYFSKYASSLVESESGRTAFLNSYSALRKLSDLTEISEGDSNNFLQIQNSSTHEPTLLDEKVYIPSAETSFSNFEYDAPYSGAERKVNGKVLKMDTLYQAASYDVNAASYIALGKWFDYLKDNDCWDNTRIIIVSDHGWGMRQFDEKILSDDLNVEPFCPLLLVKDFNSEGIRESTDFMTTADVPNLATSSIIMNPINPFSGNSLADDLYKTKAVKVTTSAVGVTDKNVGNVFDTSDGVWYDVTPGDILDVNNWKVLR